MESTIVDNPILKEQLFKLCGFSLNQRFELLYRGTSHGFKASDFHDYCDNIPRTLTIVKSTNGNIFGGYTEATWDKSDEWKCDKNAFLFSLVNKKNVPVKVNIANDKTDHAIFCCANIGPTFGSGFDMHIGDNSNTTRSSYAKFSFSYELPFMPHRSQNAQLFLADSKKFQVHDIEVFLII